MKRVVLALIAAFAASGYTCAARFGPDVGSVFPDDRTGRRCTGALRGTFDDVIVPAGASCTIRNSVVHGNLKARESAELYVLDTRVQGTIQGDGARIVEVSGGQVDGDIQIVGGTSPGSLGAAVAGGTVVTRGNIQIQGVRTGSILVVDAHVATGNIQVSGNETGDRLEILRNFTGANLQVFSNTGPGQKVVTGNTVAHTLQCRANTAPFVGGPNSAGSVEGQCF